MAGDQLEPALAALCGASKAGTRAAEQGYLMAHCGPEKSRAIARW